MKSSSSIWRASVLSSVLACLCVLGLNAQTNGTGTVPTPITPTSTATGPAKGIGPAPANSTQHQILNKALSTETRQTLQEAMNSSGK